MATKICVKCQQPKTVDNFYKKSNQKDGLDYYCKYCRMGHSLKSIRNTKKPNCSIDGCFGHHYAKSYCRVHYSRFIRNGTVERLNDIRDVKNPKHRYHKTYELNTTYKMDLNEFLQKASKGCEICKIIPKESLHVDHDHNCCAGEKTCGVCVRGIVCAKCNTAIAKYEKGILRPDYALYKKVKNYVRKYNG